jgi:hypothetical protein
MVKSAITDYSSTAADNTDIGGVDSQGSAAASNIDDLIRELASHLADMNAGTAPLADTFCIGDAADLTKKLRFDCGTISAATTRVLTMPDADVTLVSGTVVTETGTQTLTNKTLTSPVIGTGLELGAATDTTLTRGAAGFMAVEGNRVPSPASQATGDVLYRGATEWERLAIGTAGQVLKVNTGATAPAWANGLTSGTATASTSGTTVDFGSIPAGVKRIVVQFIGVSISGTDNLILQIGDAGGIEPTGYLGGALELEGSGQSTLNPTTGFAVTAAITAATVMHGTVTLTLQNAATFTWVSTGMLGHSDSGRVQVSGSSKSLSAELTQLRITTVSGSDTFDAGSINILYE